MTSAGPHVGASILDTSLATANLIHSYALPVLIVGAVLTLAGTVGVVVSDGMRGRAAAQALKIASLQTLPVQTASVQNASVQTGHVQPVETTLARPAPAPVATTTPPPAVVPAPKAGVARNQLMTATIAPQTLAPQVVAPKIVAPLAKASAANPIPDSVEAPASPATTTAKLAVRTLSEKQRASMLEALRGAAEDIWFVTARDPEAQRYADQLGEVFREAGWTDHHALVLHPGQPFQGVSAALKATSADRSVSRAFAAAGVPLSFREKTGEDPAPTVYIGSSNAAP